MVARIDWGSKLARIITDYKQGVTIKELEMRHGCSARSISKQLAIVGIHRKKVDGRKNNHRPSQWTEGREAELIRLYNENKSIAEISQVLGCSKKAAEGRIDKLGLVRKHPGNRLLEEDKRKFSLGMQAALRSYSQTLKLRPKHSFGLETGSIEWFEACNTAFCRAMRANPDERPSEMRLKQVRRIAA